MQLDVFYYILHMFSALVYKYFEYVCAIKYLFKIIVVWDSQILMKNRRNQNFIFMTFTHYSLPFSYGA